MSADNGRALIDAVRRDILQKQQQDDDIVNKYTALKICFCKGRANGNAKRAIDYLLLRPMMANNEEQKFVNDVRDYFEHHIPKHFCHDTIMGESVEAFKAAGIDAPKDKSPYTSMSYTGKQEYNQAQTIAKKIYPKIVTYLLNIYDCTFDVSQNNEGISFTIRLTKGRSTPNIENSGNLRNMARLSINELINIYTYKNIRPKIYNIQNYNKNGENSEPVLLTNNFFHLFFNIDIQFYNNLSIKGSIFPAAI